MKRFIIILLMSISIIVFCFSAYKIINWFSNNNRNKKINEDIHEYIKADDSIDFAKLKEKNSDMIAYLKVNNTNIDYTVVRGSDNDYYLNHNFNKEYNQAGWIFMDYRNRFDGSDKNIIIYGHNMLDGSMFSSLNNVLSKSWSEDENNLNIKLIGESGISIYRVFSVYQIEAEDYYIKTEFNDGEFDKFIHTLKDRSIYDFNTEVYDFDSILTLSTCSLSGSERVVLHAKLID